MKKLMTAALALSFALMSTAAFAQPEPGDAGVFADVDGTLTSLQTGPFVAFTFYVVGFDLVNQPNAFEFGLEVPAGLTLTGDPALAGPNPGNIGGNFNVIAFTGGCVDASGTWVMAAYEGVFLSDPGADAAIVMGPSTPTSFDPAAPGYSQCDGTLVPFGVAANGGGVYPDNALIINPTQDPPVAIEDESFGQVKARF